MGPRPRHRLLLAVALVALTASPGTGGASSPAAGDRRAAELERQLGPGVEVSVHRETGAVRFVGAAPGDPIGRPAGVPAAAPAGRVARAFLERYGTYFGLRDQARELKVESVGKAPGGRSSVRFQQLHRGVPVLGGELVVNLDRNGDLLSVSGEVLPSPALGVEPSVEPNEAEDAALTAVAKVHGLDRADLRAAAPRLQVYDSRLLGGPGLGRPALVWRTEVRSSAAGEPIRELVLVDARLGTVALHFNQIAHAKDRQICDANNTAAQYPCTSPVRSEGGPPHAVQDVNDAYDFSGDTYDFYFDRFGRDSLDGAGMSLISTVRYCDPSSPCPYENAFWDGAQMVYGEGFAAADDVVGHELTHGFTEFTSHLFYYYQAGAINESLSDVFGELIDLSNGAGTDTAASRWLLGEDIPGIGAIRDMQDPPAFGDPDRMTSANYTADSSETDSGGVHANSGVNNKAAYLITDGDTFNGRTVTGLGIDKAAWIYYAAETGMLTSASDYADLRDALNQACANLVGTHGITAPDCVEVEDAALAVEMDQQPPAAPAPEAPTCTGGATPVNSFFDDLENTGSGNWTKTTLVGTNEWYYPQNPNPYDFDATYATSGDTNFWGYDRPSLGDFSIAMTSDVTVPSGGLVRFEHAFGFEDSQAPPRNWDGGVVEYSTNGGASWTDAGPLFVDNGYTGIIYAGGQANNPLKGRNAFVAESNGYISSRLDLSSLAGQGVRFRFRIGTDSVVDDYGWFIDDVRIYRCVGSDTDPPETTIDSGPSGPTNDSTPTFGFSADEPGSSFECRFDADPFAACSGPGATHTPSSPLGEGPHSFEVRATDASTNTDPTPASRAFTIDTQAPDPPSVTDTDPDSPANDNNPEVKGFAEAGSTVKLYTSADCTGSVAAQGTAAAFASPGLTVTVGNNSTTTFRATAADAAGNPSPCSAGLAYIEDSLAPGAPTITDADPDSPANDNNPELKGSAEAGSTVRLYTTSGCTGSVAAQGSAVSFASPGLTATVADNSTTTFKATATDAAGNASPCSAGLVYVEDSASPQSTIDSGPSGPTNDSTPSFGFSADEAGSSFECRFDSDPFGACSGPGATHTPSSPLSDDPHTFDVRATDPAGNADPTPAGRGFTVDTQPPTVSVDSGPAGPTNDSTPTFGFSAEGGASLACSIDTGSPSFGACSAPTSHTPDPPLPDGPYTFRIRATDSAGNPATATRSFTLDTDPPETTIDSGPSGPTDDSAPAFGFSADEPGSSFECRFDSDPFAACSGPGATHTPSSPLSDNPHTFHVRAIDPVTNTDPTPATRSFTVDTQEPDPPSVTDTDPDSPANDNNPEVKGSAEAGSTVKLYTGADCSGSVAAQGTAAAFASPGLTANVADDSTTTFRATATDAAGNPSACSAGVDYTEDSMAPDAPTITDTDPDSPANDNNPEVKGTVGAGSPTQVKLYKNAACSGSPAATGSVASFTGAGITVTVTGDQTTTLSARAADAAGNDSGCSNSIDYTEDSAAPQTQIDSGPAGPTNDSTPTFGFSADEPGSSFECRFDSDPFAACSGPGATHTPSSPLSDDPHTFDVRATDAAGNTDQTPASRAFTLDTMAPDPPTISDTDPDSPSGSATPKVKGTASADTGTVEVFTQASCQGALAASGAKTAFEGTGITVAVSPNQTTTLSARAADAAGNDSGCSNDFNYTHQAIPPDSPAPTDTDPNSPANENNPAVKGSAEPGSTVSIYAAPTTADCTPANLRATGTEAAFASPGLTVPVADDTATTLRATATNGAGTSDCSPDSIAYTEDSAAPNTQIDSGPADPTDDSTPGFGFSSDEPGSSFECRIDFDPFAACSGPAATHTPPDPLADGPHTFEVRATDQAANTDPTPAARGFTIDTEPGGTPTALCAGQPATILGTASPDLITGTKKRDVITTLGGNDLVRAGGGRDLVCGGSGRDRLLGQAGPDRLLGQGGPDGLAGGSARDLLLGGGGRDLVLGQGGPRDVCNGGGGRDRRRTTGCEQVRKIP